MGDDQNDRGAVDGATYSSRSLSRLANMPGRTAIQQAELAIWESGSLMPQKFIHKWAASPQDFRSRTRLKGGILPHGVLV